MRSNLETTQQALILEGQFLFQIVLFNQLNLFNPERLGVIHIFRRNFKIHIKP